MLELTKRVACHVQIVEVFSKEHSWRCGCGNAKVNLSVKGVIPRGVEPQWGLDIQQVERKKRKGCQKNP